MAWGPGPGFKLQVSCNVVGGLVDGPGDVASAGLHVGDSEGVWCHQANWSREKGRGRKLWGAWILTLRQESPGVPPPSHLLFSPLAYPPQKAAGHPSNSPCAEEPSPATCHPLSPHLFQFSSWHYHHRTHQVPFWGPIYFLSPSPDQELAEDRDPVLSCVLGAWDIAWHVMTLN